MSKSLRELSLVSWIHLSIEHAKTVSMIGITNDPRKIACARRSMENSMRCMRNAQRVFEGEHESTLEYGEVSP